MKQKYYRWKAIKDLIKKYLYLIEVDNLLEAYETDKILNGSLSEKQLSESRTELLRIQFRLKSQQAFVDYLKSLSK